MRELVIRDVQLALARKTLQKIIENGSHAHQNSYENPDDTTQFPLMLGLSVGEASSALQAMNDLEKDLNEDGTDDGR